LKNIIYNIFIYFSIIFLCVALYRADYLKIPEIHSLTFLLLSIPFLFAGFIGNAYAWQKSLEQAGFKVGFKESFNSIGLSMFGKYIPGKIWMVMGRSGYLATKKNYSISQLSIISLNAQIITLWVGLMIGFIGLCFLEGFGLYGWFMVFLGMILSALIFSPFFHSLISSLIRLVLRDEINLPRLTNRSVILILPSYFAYWILWSVGFYFLSISLLQTDVSWLSGFGFPLASTIGIMAIFSPGGLGVREVIITGYLTLSGISLSESTTVAVTARLWFLLGEISVFIAAWVLRLRDG